MSNTISFPKMFNKTDYKMKTDVSYSLESINESLKSLLSTTKGELLGDPLYGSTLKELLFELKTTKNMFIIKRTIVEDILKYVKGISTNESMIKIYSNPNNNKYKIIVGYYVLPNNEKYTFETIVNM